jgi:hypothetical protein
MKTLYQIVYDKQIPRIELQYVTKNGRHLLEQSECIPLKNIHTTYRDVENGSLALIFYEGVILFLYTRSRCGGGNGGVNNEENNYQGSSLSSFELSILKEYPTDKYITGHVIAETKTGIKISADNPFSVNETQLLQQVCRSTKCHQQTGIYITYFKKIFTSKL